jgi:hypothetical protein
MEATEGPDELFFWSFATGVGPGWLLRSRAAAETSAKLRPTCVVWLPTSISSLGMRSGKR